MSVRHADKLDSLQLSRVIHTIPGLVTLGRVEVAPTGPLVYRYSIPMPNQSKLDEGHDSVHLVNFRWLTTLRWAAVVGQTLAVVVVRGWLNIPIPLGEIATVISLELCLNLAALLRGKSQLELREQELASWVSLDLVAFTALLFFTGGPRNPFSFFYVVHVAMAALTLRPLYSWSLVALSVLGYGSLLKWNVPLPPLGHVDLEVHGSWAAYALGASCIVYFLQRARQALRKREGLLSEQRDLRLQAERLSSLGTLAAGAAHELANPLGTIAVVSKELQHTLRTSGLHTAMADVELVRSQVERCRKILTHMAHTAGEVPGEADRWVLLEALLTDSIGELSQKKRVSITINVTKNTEIKCPTEALAQALRVLVDNALDASKDTVTVTASDSGAELLIRVVDRGPGMSEAVLQRAFEPFFTTKPTGRGMGLGLFLARNVVLRLGGALRLVSSPLDGTRAELHLPPHRLRRAQLP